MHRVTLAVAAAVLLAACGDRAADPTSPLRPTTAVRDLGTPPPPPVAGEGRADFEAFPSEDSETSCSVNTTFNFSYEYFRNANDNNAFLHIRSGGPGLDVAIHQTAKKVDAKGNITGDGFTFAINNVLSGDLTDPEEHVPNSVTFQLTGKLTTGDATCNANATLFLDLTNSPDTPPPVIVP